MLDLEWEFAVRRHPVRVNSLNLGHVDLPTPSTCVTPA
jgi:hypothetical protein